MNADPVSYMGGNQDDSTSSECKGVRQREIPSFIYSSGGEKDGFPKSLSL